MSIRYEQVLPGQGEFFAYLAAPDIISRLDRGDLTGIAAISGTDEADTPAGLAGISKEDDGTLRLDWLYVDRDHRGKGIGKRLLELTLRIAARNGAAYVVARIYPGIMEEPLFSGDMISFIRSIWKAGIKEREALWMLSKRELMTEDFVHKAATRLESMPGRVYAFKELPESTLRSILAPLGAAGELKGLSREKLVEMWKDRLPGMSGGYVPGEEDIIEIRNAYLQDRLTPEQLKAYNSSMKSGDDTGATFTLLKEAGVWDMYRLLAVTQRYYQFAKTAEESTLHQLEKTKRAPVKGKARIGGKKLPYEKKVSNNCYACAGSKMINHLMKDDNGKDQLDQFRVRSFEPRYLGREAFNAFAPYKDYDKALPGIQRFAGAKRQHFGNFFSISDVLFDKREHGGLGHTNIALRRSTFVLKRTGDPVIEQNLIEAIKQKLLTAASAGRMTTLFTHSHYVTVTGIEGNNISYLDSLVTEEHRDPTRVITMDIRDFLKGNHRSYDAVELTEAFKLDKNSRAELQNEYEGFGINENTGEIIRKNDISSDEDVAHRAGIVIAKSYGISGRRRKAGHHCRVPEG